MGLWRAEAQCPAKLSEGVSQGWAICDPLNVSHRRCLRLM